MTFVVNYHYIMVLTQFQFPPKKVEMLGKMFKKNPIFSFTLSVKILAHLEFEGSNTSKRKFERGQQTAEK